MCYIYSMNYLLSHKKSCHLQQHGWTGHDHTNSERERQTVFAITYRGNVQVDTHELIYQQKQSHRFRKLLRATKAKEGAFWREVEIIHGEGNGTPLQYSCLENPMDGGAW